MEYSANGRGVESGVPFHLKIVRLAGHMGSIPKFPRIFLHLQMKKILLGGFVYENEKQGVVNCWNNRLYRDESQYHKF